MAGTDSISRAEAIAIATHEGAYGYISAQELAELPSAERTGKWINITNVGNGMFSMQCSECGNARLSSNRPNYCENCGARMEGEEE